MVSKLSEEIRQSQETVEELKQSEKEQEKNIDKLKKEIQKKNREMNEYQRFYDTMRKTVRLEVEQTRIDENIPVKVMFKLKKPAYLKVITNVHLI